MRPVEYSQEQIIEAGKDLLAAGRNITGFALRQRVGGGNPTRLKQTWDEYISSQAVTAAEPVAELPVEVAEEVATVTKALTDRLAALAVELNDKAVKAAERRVAEVIRAGGEQREQAERELADASQTVEDLENKLDESKAKTEALEHRLHETQTIHQDQSVELAQVRERLALMEQTYADKVAKLTDAALASDAKNQKLIADLATAKAEANHQAAEAKANHQAHQEQRKHASKVEAERDEARKEAEKLRGQIEANHQAHQEQRKHAAAEAHRVAEQLTKAKADRDEARKEARSAREASAKLQGTVESLQAQMDKLMRTLIQPDAKQEPAKVAGKTKTTQ